MVDDRLDEFAEERLEWDPRPAVCVVMASQGYPGNFQKGKVITGLAEAAKLPDVKVFHAGTQAATTAWCVTDGGRVLGVTALGDTLADAKRNAYEAVGEDSLPGAHYRKDIADKALAGATWGSPASHGACPRGQETITALRCNPAPARLPCSCPASNSAPAAARHGHGRPRRLGRHLRRPGSSTLWAMANLARVRNARCLTAAIFRWTQYRIPLWAVTLKDTGRWIGRCGFQFQDDARPGPTELAYSLARDGWSQGYATEAARACVAHAFEVLGWMH